MSYFLPTIIYRHRKENLKKCSLKGLENHPDLNFFTYPIHNPEISDNYLLLDIDGEELSKKDIGSPLFLIDGTWRHAEKMKKRVSHLKKRSIPKGFITAYPRKQEDCMDPSRGLASVEALYIAHRILYKNDFSLLNYYYWKDLFLEKNHLLLNNL